MSAEADIRPDSDGVGSVRRVLARIIHTHASNGFFVHHSLDGILGGVIEARTAPFPL